MTVGSKFKSAAALAAAILLMSSRSSAQAPADLHGWFELNTFRPASTPLDGLSIEKAKVLDSLQPSVGSYLQFDDDPLTWQRETADGWDETAVAVERLVVLHFTGAVGLFDFAQIAAHFPIYLDKGTPDSSGGVGDLGVVPKAAIRTDFEGGEAGLAAVVPLFFPLGDEKSFAGKGEFAIAPGIAADVSLARFSAIVNAGIAFQKERKGEFAPDRGNELMLGLGAEYDLASRPDRFRALAEIKMSTQLSDPFGRTGTPTCVLGGLSYRFDAGIAVTAAGGAGVSPGVGSPDLRVLAGIGWVPLAGRDDGRAAAEKPTADADRDGIANMNDKCPKEPEDFDKFEDDDGCPDLDNDKDRVADKNDACPDNPETVNGADDDDGCPDMDQDSDRITDIKDACPTEAEDADRFEDENGCPDNDNDKDGIQDANDRCPLLSESFNGVEDEDGCPDYFVLEGAKIRFKTGIDFAEGQARLKRSGHKALEELAASIVENPSWEEIRISVYTSGDGNPEADQLLSEERAVAVMRFLVSLGVVPERLIAEGKGSGGPQQETGKVEGDRVEIEIKTRQTK